jgi:hypothetical protein
MSKLNIKISRARLGAAFASGLLIFTSLSVGFASPAHAATGCTESRSTAESLANSGNFVEAVSVPLNLGGKATLRYSSDSGCAWGLVSDLGPAADTGYQYGWIWLDRSADGGRTWQGLLGQRGTGGFQRSTYTGTFNTINNDSVRACGQTMVVIPGTNETVTGEIGCTAWFFPARLSVNQTMGGRGFSSLSSPNNRYVLRMQDDGNLVLYSFGRAVWASNTFVRGSIVKMQGDGNLVIIAPGNRAVWASNSRGDNSIFVLQNDGNMVIIAPGNRVIWASGTNGR